jgi:hypothetical protein
MVPTILRVGVLELLDDVAIKGVVSGEQVHPHSDKVFDIFVIRVTGYCGVVLRCFEEKLLVNLDCFTCQLSFSTVYQQEKHT